MSAASKACQRTLVFALILFSFALTFSLLPLGTKKKSVCKRKEKRTFLYPCFCVDTLLFGTRFFSFLLHALVSFSFLLHTFLFSFTLVFSLSCCIRLWEKKEAYERKKKKEAFSLSFCIRFFFLSYEVRFAYASFRAHSSILSSFFHTRLCSLLSRFRISRFTRFKTRYIALLHTFLSSSVLMHPLLFSCIRFFPAFPTCFTSLFDR